MTPAEMLRTVAMPQRLQRLPTDGRGYPIPRFVKWFHGKPDFRVLDEKHFARVIKKNVCWICGEPLGRMLAFVLGPMCAINRTSAEGPCHYDCARYACRVCPFLAIPRMHRLDNRGFPEDVTVAGFMLPHNPGVALLWVTRAFSLRRVEAGGPSGAGVLFSPGTPERVEWWAEGRSATPDEVWAATAKGLPKLIEAAQRYDGPDGLMELMMLAKDALPYFPGTRTRDGIMEMVGAARAAR